MISDVYQTFVEGADDSNNEDQEEMQYDAELAIQTADYKRYINASAELQNVDILDLS